MNVVRNLIPTGYRLVLCCTRLYARFFSRVITVMFTFHMPFFSSQGLFNRYMLSFSIHRAKDSYLSWGSGFAHFEGVMNWAFLMLAIGGIRLFLENFNK